MFAVISIPLLRYEFLGCPDGVIALNKPRRMWSVIIMAALNLLLTDNFLSFVHSNSPRHAVGRRELSLRSQSPFTSGTTISVKRHPGVLLKCYAITKERRGIHVFLTSANRYYLYQGFVRMNSGIDGLFKIIRFSNEGAVSSFPEIYFYSLGKTGRV